MIREKPLFVVPPKSSSTTTLHLTGLFYTVQYLRPLPLSYQVLSAS